MSLPLQILAAVVAITATIKTVMEIRLLTSKLKTELTSKSPDAKTAANNSIPISASRSAILKELVPCVVFIGVIVWVFLSGWVETRSGLAVVVALTIFIPFQATMPFFLMILAIFEKQSGKRQ